ncbi:MAG TPA: alkaline phosphatase family protein [Jatrophihabitans sp.]|jgi:acid phosphatase
MLFAVLATVATTGAVLSTASGADGAAGAAPIRAAFYYPWYPETEHWATHYSPSLGHYDSSDPAVLAAHVAAAKYAGLDAFIASWWGQGTPTDKRLPLLLSAAQRGGLSVAPYYEPEGQTPAPSAAQLGADLQYLYAKAQASPAWLRVNGKPVLFVYNSHSTDCSVTTRWNNANAGRFYIDLKVFSGYQNCPDQPDSWHQYGPASDYDQQGTYSSSVSPGFWKFDESNPRLPRDLSRFSADLHRQVTSGARWQLLTTFNEWGEGTAVESATQWSSASGYGAYLDAMHAAYGSAPATPGTSSSSSTATSTPPSSATSSATSTPPSSGTSTPPTSANAGLVADAGVNSADPSTNDGTATTVGLDASPQRYGYFRYQVSVPAGQTITRATFSCYSISSNADGAAVYAAGDGWTENGLTWQNKPAVQAVLGHTGAVTGHSYSPAVDVTSAVHGSGDYTFALSTASNRRWSCASRENTGAHPARLALTLSGSTAPPSSSTPPPPSSSTPPPSSSTRPPPSSSTPPPPSSSTPPPSSSTPPPSSSSTPPASGHKVLVIPLENHSQSETLAQMPYLTSLANSFGSATNYFAVGHPSLPNYLAIFGGSTFGVTSDCSVGSSGCVPAAPSVWGQAAAAGVSARAYQESMTSNCQTSGSGNYAPRHGPWPYWTDAADRSACQANDVPSGTTSSGPLASDVAAGKLPVVGELTPNLCNDAHDCSLATADGWLKSWLPVIMNGADYKAGRLTVIITFDEDDSSQGNKVAFVVVDPRLSGKTVTTNANHYSLTRWLDSVAGLPLLRNAASAVDLRSMFGL